MSRKSCKFINSLFIELLYPVVLVRDASNFSVLLLLLFSMALYMQGLHRYKIIKYQAIQNDQPEKKEKDFFTD